MPSPPAHDDLLFLAQLYDGFYGLMRLGELVWPDNASLRSFDKVIRRTSVKITESYHSFLLPRHKSDTSFEGSTIVIQRAASADPHHTFTSYLASRDKLFPFNSSLWLRNDGSIPTQNKDPVARVRGPQMMGGHNKGGYSTLNSAKGGGSKDCRIGNKDCRIGNENCRDNSKDCWGDDEDRRIDNEDCQGGNKDCRTDSKRTSFGETRWVNLLRSTFTQLPWYKQD
ncbi:hypothetical protein EV424DRAFT_1582225 [Suillus variegatus]|nr:hypothetical protein EV424DRAFT_1582225 [Suillus variegatus]